MNISELRKVLLLSGVPETYFSIGKENLNDRCCIERKGIIKDHWEVYYGERGVKKEIKIFYTEDDACIYFKDWLIRLSLHR